MAAVRIVFYWSELPGIARRCMIIATLFHPSALSVAKSIGRAPSSALWWLRKAIAGSRPPKSEKARFVISLRRRALASESLGPTDQGKYDLGFAGPGLLSESVIDVA